MSDNEDDLLELQGGEIENGHISLSASTETLTTSSDEEQPQPDNNGQFDRDLPTAHRYLGKLNNVRGYTLYDDGEIVKVLAIYTDTLVFPGFTLPLIIGHEEVNIMQRYLQNNRVFVLISTKPGDAYKFFNYGVTMEIYETQIQNELLNLKAKGRQRCKLISGYEIRTLHGRLREVTVKMLGEPVILTPLCDTQMLALKAKRLFVSRDFNELKSNYKYRRYHLSQYPFASWVYDRYEVGYYVRQIMKRLTNYVGEYIPDDPVQLSYWVVQNYQLRNEERLKILELNSTLERLKLELTFLEMRRLICCACGLQVTEPNKIITMSKEGMQSNYVNPGGYVHETITVSNAKNFKLVGKPSSQFSWFPGYAWTIMQCKNCDCHLGWQFVSSKLKPSCFYGLSKGALNIVNI